jgi:hypothetical protein
MHIMYHLNDNSDMRLRGASYEIIPATDHRASKVASSRLFVKSVSNQKTWFGSD